MLFPKLLVPVLLFACCVVAQSLPQVDLGYEVRLASSFNQTAQVYNFSNIRYAQAPDGTLRWAPPVPPSGRNPAVQDGSVGHICPQASPAWEFIASEFLEALIAGNASSFNYTEAEQQLEAYLSSGAATPKPDPRTSEDCLFLDVFVPKGVFDNASSRLHPRQWNDWNGQGGHGGGGKGGAPVLVWIYGGGYTAGWKNLYGSPNGLIKASQAAGGPGVIYVAMNYRLGALGWLAGSSLQSSGGVSNAGLYDQRLAIEWVTKYIHLFGGDPKQITIFGESAGGGSVEHQITAFGGKKGVSFQRALTQSSGFDPLVSPAEQEAAAQAYLKLLNVSTIDEARQLPSSAIIAANTEQVGLSPYGTFTYGPVVDGVFVPNLPSQLLASGQFAHNLQIMTGHNKNEGPLFAPPYVKTDAQFRTWLATSYPDLPDSTIDYIATDLYPPDYSGSRPYTSPLGRLFLVITEAVFSCNTYYLNTAFHNLTHAYEFQVPPAVHGQDVAYTYYNGQGTDIGAGLLAPLAKTLQGYITNFAMTGNPNAPGLPVFPIQGTNASMNALTVTGVKIERDDTVNRRCQWWQQALAAQSP